MTNLNDISSVGTSLLDVRTMRQLGRVLKSLDKKIEQLSGIDTENVVIAECLMNGINAVLDVPVEGHYVITAKFTNSVISNITTTLAIQGAVFTVVTSVPTVITSDGETWNVPLFSGILNVNDTIEVTVNSPDNIEDMNLDICLDYRPV